MTCQGEGKENCAVELHDGTLLSCRSVGDALILVLGELCVHRSNGVPGRDAGTCWRGKAVIRFQQGHIVEGLPILPAGLVNGELSVGDKTYRNVIPVPLDYVGESKMVLLFDDATEVGISAVQVAISLEGELEFVEEFT